MEYLIFLAVVLVGVFALEHYGTSQVKYWFYLILLGGCIVLPIWLLGLFIFTDEFHIGVAIRVLVVSLLVGLWSLKQVRVERQRIKGAVKITAEEALEWAKRLKREREAEQQRIKEKEE